MKLWQPYTAFTMQPITLQTPFRLCTNNSRVSLEQYLALALFVAEHAQHAAKCIGYADSCEP